MFLINRVLNFVRKNGIDTVISRIQSHFRQNKKHSYKSLLNKFPQKFTLPPQIFYDNTGARITAIDSAAQICLKTLMGHFNINQDPVYVLSATRNLLKENNYYQVLDDLFTLDEILAKPSATQYPIIQSSQLPELAEDRPGKRILFITSKVPSSYHGGGNRILNFIKILSENNDIYLVTAYHPYEDDDALGEIAAFCHSIYKIPYWRFGNNQAEIRKWLAGTVMDVVHYEWLTALENLDPALGHRHIFTYMEALSLRLLIDLEKTPPLSSLWLDIFTQLIHTLRIEIADTIPLDARIAVTTKDGEFFRSIYPHQEYTVLNHGVNLDEFIIISAVKSEPQTLVFVGNFDHYPNVEAMIYFFAEIWDGIRKEEPNVRIYIVGPNPPGEITCFADDQQVIITGSVPDVRPYIQKATVCIAPLISGAGLRGKVIEYAALKRSVVATSIATTDLIFKDQVDYLLADSAPDFTQRVVTLLKDKNRRDTIAASAYEVVQKSYDIRRLTQFLYRLYDHLEQESHKQ